MLGLAAVPRSTASPGEVFAQLLPWIIGLIVLIAIGAVVILLVRRRLQNSTNHSQGTFTLHDLRALHAAGQISDEEFERAKLLIIGQVAGGSARAGSGDDRTRDSGAKDRSSTE